MYKGFQGDVPPRQTPKSEAYSIDDYQDHEKIFSLLQRLPRELQAVHLVKIADLEDDDAVRYLQDIYERREDAMSETEVSDPHIRAYFEAHKDEIVQALETYIFLDEDITVGSGGTAKVKSYRLDDFEHNLSVALAIKYLITPNEKTLSVSGEHDLLVEVERLQLIEQAEEAHLYENQHLRVPHPYFYHKHGPIQCYGMELIGGTDLFNFANGAVEGTLYDSLKAAFAGIDREELFREVDVFFDAMHTICIHRDVKDANVMVTPDGKFYLIDFGQSELISSAPQYSAESLENKKEDDKRNMKLVLTQFLTRIES